MPRYPFKAFMDFGSVLSGGNTDLHFFIICVTDSRLSMHVENQALNTPFYIQIKKVTVYICCVSGKYLHYFLNSLHLSECVLCLLDFTESLLSS